MFPIAILCQNSVYDDWEIFTSRVYSKEEKAHNKALITSAFNTSDLPNTNWLTGLTKTKFHTSSMDFTFTAANYISANLHNAGLTHRVYANCYNSSNTFLGAVGFGYTFFLSGTTKFQVYIIRDMREVGGDFNANEVSGALSVLYFDPNDVFKLSVNTTTRAWTVSKDTNVASGSDSLGLLPAGTTYVRYYFLFNVGADMVGTAELEVKQITSP